MRDSMESRRGHSVYLYIRAYGMPPFFTPFFCPFVLLARCLAMAIPHLLRRTGEKVGVPPLGGFVAKAFITRPPKGGTPTL
jgi:hypothetical protein